MSCMVKQEAVHLQSDSKSQQMTEVEGRPSTPTTNKEGFGDSERPTSPGKTLHSAFKLPASMSINVWLEMMIHIWSHRRSSL